MAVEALTAHTGNRLAEVAFVLLAVAGAWLIVAEAFRLQRARGIVAGAGIAVAGILLIVATHWGHFG